MMNRRELLKKSGLTMIGMSAFPGLAVLLESCGVESNEEYLPVNLTTEQYKTIYRIADIVLPGTNSPGSSDVGVAQFIDLLVGGYLEPDDKAQFIDRLNEFMDAISNEYTTSFNELSSSQALSIVEGMDGELREQDEGDESFYRSIKGMILWGFYTSEIGMKSMNYQPVPGQFDGCTMVDDETKNLVGNR